MTNSTRRAPSPTAHAPKNNGMTAVPPVTTGAPVKNPQPPQKGERRAVKIENLYANLELAAASNELNILLNHEPKTEWLRKHPTVSVKGSDGNWKPLLYMPIQIIEYLLISIFLRYRVEVKSLQLVANSVVVTVRLHYLLPSGEWEYQDGIGAQPIQIDKDHGATDFSHMKSNAIQIGAPAAESYAVKDAAEKIGKIFGKDLNRADYVGYEALANRFPNTESVNK